MLENTLVILAYVLLCALQVLFTVKARRRLLTFIPMTVFALGAVVLGVSAYIIQGWDALALIVFAILAAAAAVACAVGIFTGEIIRAVIRKKNK